MKKDLQKNIISAVNQNQSDIFLHMNENAKIRVMFLGNSVTKHEPKPEVGWNNDCGMEASSEEHDYVHLLVKKLEAHYGEPVSWCIVQVANFERNIAPENIEKLYSSVKDFAPDIMTMFFGANVPKTYDVDENPTYKFDESYEKLRNYFAVDKTKVFHSQGFYIRPVLDKAKEAVAKKYGEPFIHMEDIRDLEATHGFFNHPNDFGMQKIAERFWETIEKCI